MQTKSYAKWICQFQILILLALLTACDTNKSSVIEQAKENKNPVTNTPIAAANKSEPAVKSMAQAPAATVKTSGSSSPRYDYEKEETEHSEYYDRTSNSIIDTVIRYVHIIPYKGKDRVLFYIGSSKKTYTVEKEAGGKEFYITIDGEKYIIYSLNNLRKEHNHGCLDGCRKAFIEINRKTKKSARDLIEEIIGRPVDCFTDEGIAYYKMHRRGSFDYVELGHDKYDVGNQESINVMGRVYKVDRNVPRLVSSQQPNNVSFVLLHPDYIPEITKSRVPLL